jgi:hypothetical protein
MMDKYYKGWLFVYILGIHVSWIWQSHCEMVRNMCRQVPRLSCCALHARWGPWDQYADALCMYMLFSWSPGWLKIPNSVALVTCALGGLPVTWCRVHVWGNGDPLSWGCVLFYLEVMFPLLFWLLSNLLKLGCRNLGMSDGLCRS